MKDELTCGFRYLFRISSLDSSVDKRKQLVEGNGLGLHMVFRCHEPLVHPRNNLSVLDLLIRETLSFCCNALLFIVPQIWPLELALSFGLCINYSALS